MVSRSLTKEAFAKVRQKPSDRGMTMMHKVRYTACKLKIDKISGVKSCENGKCTMKRLRGAFDGKLHEGPRH